MKHDSIMIIAGMLAVGGALMYARTRAAGIAPPAVDVPVSPGAGIGQFAGQTIWGAPNRNGETGVFGIITP